MEPPHTCKAVVVHCIDFRFQKTIQELLETKFPSGFDRIALAGGVQELLEEQEESIIFKNLQLSLQLHHPNTIILIQHEDCGAYGGSKMFKGLEDEAVFQEQELKKAKTLLKQHFPQLRAETYFIRLSGDIVKNIT